MEVIAFVGPSGTGKSHRALVVAHDNDIECLIDDGILIYQNRIVAGFSAKKESSRLRAVRRAIFQDAKQVASVKKELERIQPKKILILGTSENMVTKITTALNIPAPSRFIHIEDVASSREIERAQFSRLKEGKHIIPVPTMELKPHFKGYLIDPIKSLFRRSMARKSNNSEWYEKSVVRPAFSYYGRLTFSDNVIHSLVKNAASKVRGLVEINELRIRKNEEGSNGLHLTIAVSISYGYPVKNLMSKVQRAITDEIEYITGMSVDRMQITIKHMVETERKNKKTLRQRKTKT